jgi:hypothetical protein
MPIVIVLHIVIHLKQKNIWQWFGAHTHLVFLIQLYNKIFLAKEVRKVRFGEGVQTTFWTHKMEFSPKFKEATIMT